MNMILPINIAAKLLLQLAEDDTTYIANITCAEANNDTETIKQYLDKLITIINDIKEHL